MILSDVTAKVVDGDGQTIILDKYIVVAPDGTISADGIKMDEVSRILAKLISASMSHAAAVAYDIGYQSGMACDDESAQDNYDMIQKDLAMVNDDILSIEGEQY